MAETTQIVIFPKVRCSELERDVEEKRRSLVTSQDAFVSAARQKARPFVFIKEHPKLLFGLLFTFFSSSKFLLGIGTKLVGRKKKSILWKIIKAGWFWKASKMGVSWLISKKSADLEKIGLQVLQSFLNKKKTR